MSIKRVSFSALNMDLRPILYKNGNINLDLPNQDNSPPALKILSIPLFFDYSDYLKKIDKSKLLAINLYNVYSSKALSVYYVMVNKDGQLCSAKTLFNNIYELLAKTDIACATRFYREGSRIESFADENAFIDNYKKALDSYKKLGFDYDEFLKEQPLGINANNHAVFGNQFWRYYVKDKKIIPFTASADDYQNAHLWLLGLCYSPNGEVNFHPNFALAIQGLIDDKTIAIDYRALDTMLNPLQAIANSNLACRFIDNQLVMGIIEYATAKHITPQLAIKQLKRHLHQSIANLSYQENQYYNILRSAFKIHIDNADNDSFTPSSFIMFAFSAVLCASPVLAEKNKENLFTTDVDNTDIKPVLAFIANNLKLKALVLESRAGVASNFDSADYAIDNNIKTLQSNNYPVHQYTFSVINNLSSNTPTNAYADSVIRWFEDKPITITYPVHLKILASLKVRHDIGRSIFFYPVESKLNPTGLDTSDGFYHYLFANYKDVKIFAIMGHLLSFEMGRMPYRVLVVGDKVPYGQGLEKKTVVELFQQQMVVELSSIIPLYEQISALMATFTDNIAPTVTVGDYETMQASTIKTANNQDDALSTDTLVSQEAVTDEQIAVQASDVVLEKETQAQTQTTDDSQDTSDSTDDTDDDIAQTTDDTQDSDDTDDTQDDISDDTQDSSGYSDEMTFSDVYKDYGQPNNKTDDYETDEFDFGEATKYDS